MVVWRQRRLERLKYFSGCTEIPIVFALVNITVQHFAAEKCSIHVNQSIPPSPSERKASRESFAHVTDRETEAELNDLAKVKSGVSGRSGIRNQECS